MLRIEPFEGAAVLAKRLGEVIAGLNQQGLSKILTESDLSCCSCDSLNHPCKGKLALAARCCPAGTTDGAGCPSPLAG